jgi:hypothetical protein
LGLSCNSIAGIWQSGNDFHGQYDPAALTELAAVFQDRPSLEKLTVAFNFLGHDSSIPRRNNSLNRSKFDPARNPSLKRSQSDPGGSTVAPSAPSRDIEIPRRSADSEIVIDVAVEAPSAASSAIALWQCEQLNLKGNNLDGNIIVYILRHTKCQEIDLSGSHLSNSDQRGVAEAISSNRCIKFISGLPSGDGTNGFGVRARKAIEKRLIACQGVSFENERDVQRRSRPTKWRIWE